MKIFKTTKFILSMVAIVCASIFSNLHAQQNVSISDFSTSPDASSVLDINSTSKGLLIPRVALTATNVGSPITLPATSMLVYNTATAGVSPNNVIPGYYYNAGTPVAPNWLRVYAGSATGAEWKLLGNAGTTAGTNFLGTTDAVDLVFRTNNTEKVRIMSGGNVGIGTSSPSNKLSVITSTSNDGIYVSDGTRWTLHLPGTTGSGSYNNIVAANDNALIFSGGSIGTGNLVIAPWAAATTGIKILGSNGNVGVGISPNDRFEVFPTGGKSVLLGGGATTGSELKLTNSGVVHFSIYNSGNNNLTFANTSTNYQTNTAGAALMSITSGGNVGVGTASPAYKLDLASGTFGFGSSNVRTETRNNAGLRGDAGAQSGFFETASPTNYPSGASSWWHLIDVRHSNNANNYAMQFAGSFYDQNLFFRKTSDNAAQPWTQVLTASSNLAWMTTGNTGTVASTNFLGTTDAIDFVVRTTNTERMRVLSGGNVGVGTTAPVYKFQTDGDIYANGGWFRVSGNQGYYFESWGGGWQMVDGTWIRAYNSKPILATGGLAGYGNTPFGTVFGGSPRIYANYDNVSGGGIAISDDGSLYDYNDGWITFRGSKGLFTMTNSTTSAGIYDMGTATASSATYDKNLGTNYANFGTVGSSTYYWYRMYAGGFVNSSSRDNKRNILRIDSSVNDFIMKDLENLKPSLYKYNEETDELVEGKETKYRPNYHLGLITDEAPDYLQDETFKGIDIYAASTMALLAAKNNYAEINTIKSSLGFTSENVTMQDFGSILMESKEVFVPFSNEFKEKLNGTIPVITISTSTEDANIIVIDKSAIGFKLKITGTVNNASVDYIVMAKIKVQKPIEEIPSEVINQLKVPTAEKVKIENYIEKRNSQFPSSENYNDSKFKEEAIKVQNERKSIVDNNNSNFSHPTSNPNLTEPFQKTDSQNDTNETKPLKEQKSKKLKN